MFEDKAFVQEDHPLAVRLFQETPPFLLSQLLGLTIDQWLAIERRHTRDQEKQRGGVLSTWGQRGDSAKWSVLVEALIVMGLRGKAQIACIEKGEPSWTLLFQGVFLSWEKCFYHNLCFSE